jgi:hypothetical protein
MGGGSKKGTWRIGMYLEIWLLIGMEISNVFVVLLIYLLVLCLFLLLFIFFGFHVCLLGSYLAYPNLLGTKVFVIFVEKYIRNITINNIFISIFMWTKLPSKLHIGACIQFQNEFWKYILIILSLFDPVIVHCKPLISHRVELYIIFSVWRYGQVILKDQINVQCHFHYWPRYISVALFYVLYIFYLCTQLIFDTSWWNNQWICACKSFDFNVLFKSKCSTGQVTSNSSAPVSSISLSVPAQPQHGVNINLAIGRVSGSLETWTWDPCRNQIENTSACHAHDLVVKLHCIWVCILFSKRKLNV